LYSGVAEGDRLAVDTTSLSGIISHIIFPTEEVGLEQGLGGGLREDEAETGLVAAVDTQKPPSRGTCDDD